MPKTPGGFGFTGIVLGKNWLNGFFCCSGSRDDGTQIYDFADEYNNTQLCNDINKLTNAARAATRMMS